jgi:hypothetical protein
LSGSAALKSIGSKEGGNMGKKGKGGKKPQGNNRSGKMPNGKPKRLVKQGRAEKFPHFRLYKKSNHPALITGERIPTDEYNYRKVTSSEREGRRPNEKVEPNPDKTKSTPMFIVKRTKHDRKKNFSADVFPWDYPPKKR